MEWGKKVSKKYVSKELSEKIHKKCEPFLTWLKEAEEEESDESDEEVEIGFDERAKISSMKEQVLTWVYASVPIPLNSHRLILFFSASNVLIVDLFVFYRKKIQRKMEKKSRRRQKLLPMAMRMMVMMTWILMIYKSKSMLMYIMFRFNEKISFP